MILVYPLCDLESMNY